MKNIKIAVAHGDGIGREIIGNSVRLLRAVYNKFSINAKIFPFDIGNDSYVQTGKNISAKGIALAGGCDAVLMGPVEDERSELYLAFMLGAGFCTMPVFYSSHIGASITKPRERLRPSVRLTFVLLKNFNNKYSKERIDGSIIFETVANHKEHFVKALEHCALIAAEANQRLTIVRPGIDPYYKTEIKKVFSGDRQKIDLRHITAECLAAELCTDPGAHQVVFAPCIEGGLLHSQAVALISAPQACYKEYIGSPRLYMPVLPPCFENEGQGIVSPVGAFLAISALTENVAGHKKCAYKIRKSVFTVLDKGYKTADMENTRGKAISTEEFTDRVIAQTLI